MYWKQVLKNLDNIANGIFGFLSFVAGVHLLFNFQALDGYIHSDLGIICIVLWSVSLLLMIIIPPFRRGC